jgi:hypothetical protein
MFNFVFGYAAGLASGIVLAALALHLNRKAVAKATYEYVKRHIGAKENGDG